MTTPTPTVHVKLISTRPHSSSMPVSLDGDGDVQIGDYSTPVSLYFTTDQARELAFAILRVLTTPARTEATAAQPVEDEPVPEEGVL